MNGERTTERTGKSSIVAGSLWMIVISLLLFFIPVINGLIGGLVGGYKVGTVKRGLLASLLPIVVVALGLWLLLIVLEAPVLGFVAAAAVGLWILFSDLGLVIGGAIGGALGNRQTHTPA